MRRLIIAGAVLALVGAACGDDSADTTVVTTTTVAPTITTAPPDTTAPPTTAPTTTTDTTVAPPDTAVPDDTTPAGSGEPFMGIVLDFHEGDLGVVQNWQPADEAIAIMRGLLGEPVFDSGDSTETGCPGIHRSVAFLVPAPPDGIQSRLVLHFTDGDGQFAGPVFTDWAYWGEDVDGAAAGATALLATPEGITIGSSTDDAKAAYPELDFGMNPLSGDVMGWTGDFEMIVFGDFGDGMFDMTTDFGVLHGHVSGLRLPLVTCPDELAY